MAKICDTGQGFCKYLIDNGVLSELDIEELSASKSAQGTLLGQLLLKDRAITVRQVMQLMDLQAREPEIRLGELAIREGMLTTDQLEAALAKQAASTPHAAEVIMKEGALRRSELIEVLISYVRMLEGPP